MDFGALYIMIKNAEIHFDLSLETYNCNALGCTNSLPKYNWYMLDSRTKTWDCRPLSLPSCAATVIRDEKHLFI